MGDAKKLVGNLARVEGSICALYLHREITYICSHYFKRVSLSNRSLRNDPRTFINEEDLYTLSVLNKCGCPSGSSKDYWLSDKEHRSAHVHVLINCDVVKPLLEYMALNERGGGVNCLREIFANFEGIVKINAELQRKESRKQIPKTVLR